MKITIVYDNEAEEGFKSGWGFSCLIEHHGHRILFDTGWDGNELLHNMEKIGVKKESIDMIVLSHNHWDHIGGLAQVIHPEVNVYLPISFSKRLKNEIAKKATVQEVSGPFEIMEGMHLTGELGMGIKEQSLVVDTGKGLLVITGCAHPGLDVILRAAGKLGKVTGVMGGFHGFDRLERLDDLALIVPCHCTERKKEIMERFPEKVMACGAGHSFQFSNDDEL